MYDPLSEHVGLPLMACIMPNPTLLNKIRCYQWGHRKWMYQLELLITLLRHLFEYNCKNQWCSLIVLYFEAEKEIPYALIRDKWHQYLDRNMKSGRRYLMPSSILARSSYGYLLAHWYRIVSKKMIKDGSGTDQYGH